MLRPQTLTLAPPTSQGNLETLLLLQRDTAPLSLPHGTEILSLGASGEGEGVGGRRQRAPEEVK